MLVVDASVVTELLLNTALGRRVADALGDEELHAPHLIDLEIVSVLNRLTNAPMIPTTQALDALDVLVALGVIRHDHEALLHRVHALRADLGAYDAAYVALSEGLDAPLLTCDAKLVAAPRSTAEVRLVT